MTDAPDELESIRAFYDTEYYANHRVGRLPWHTRMVARRLGDLRGKKVLDVACGAGEWLEYLYRAGAEVAGIDLSRKAIDACLRRMPNGEFVCGPAETLSFAADRFDLVTCMGSLEHFIDKPRALAEMRRVAKDSARFLILVPNAGFLTRRLGFYRGTQQTKAREDVFDLETWNGLFEGAGLRVIARWRDLHTLDRHWITRARVWKWPLRMTQALALSIWPIEWQYQVYHLCRPA